jgi:hypothetical protein
MIELEDELDFQPENKHSWIQERIARATRVSEAVRCV